MPVEIKELIIRAVVEPTQAQPGQSAAAGTSATAGGADVQAVVQECVRQVMRILSAERGR